MLAADEVSDFCLKPEPVYVGDPFTLAYTSSA